MRIFSCFVFFFNKAHPLSKQANKQDWAQVEVRVPCGLMNSGKALDLDWNINGPPLASDGLAFLSLSSRWIQAIPRKGMT